MAPIKSKSKVSKSSKSLGTKVLIPNVGQVNLHTGHLSFIRDVTGSSNTDFKSIQDLRKLIDSARRVCRNRRLGSETQAFAFFLALEDEANGCIRVESPDYATFAEVWDKYCDTKFRVRGERTLTPYGKSVSRGIFVGKPEKDKGWRDAFTSFPLHTSPCDVCLFLTSIVKTSSGSESPYGLLDVKGIHDFFLIKVGQDRITPGGEDEASTSMEEPDYNPQSPLLVEVSQVEISDEEDDVPLSTFVTPKSSRFPELKSQKESHRIGKRLAGESGNIETAQEDPEKVAPKQAETIPAVNTLVNVFTPGAIEW